MIFKTDEGGQVDLSKGVDLSIPLSPKTGPLAWYVSLPEFKPVEGDGWTGLVKKGGPVNFIDVHFNPHGNGTHTECLGHITPEIYSVNDSLKKFFFTSVVISVEPKLINGDKIITKDQLSSLSEYTNIEALIIRTIPNLEGKKITNYSNTNPPYLDASCLEIMNSIGVKHLLIDLPSVDKEKDDGVTAFHHQFWGVPENPQFDKTITEMIFVPDEVEDGEYLLNLQVAPFELDAAPSRPVIFPYRLP